MVVAGGTARAEGYRAVDLADWQRDVRAAEPARAASLAALWTRWAQGVGVKRRAEPR